MDFVILKAKYALRSSLERSRAAYARFFIEKKKHENRNFKYTYISYPF